ncbi:hypothetical protein NP233_g12909 [Leucocoprinus birnbaumii]|uniref:Uncharacterized protein n=1 Tax=Leucocoprinus birnbaumii TaxID=56174 RepID=A0AAD5VDM2_9AGAR|nr:hypothetical protein NP233_g12909 [Leucocoprinus birnbaumii]
MIILTIATRSGPGGHKGLEGLLLDDLTLIQSNQLYWYTNASPVESRQQVVHPVAAMTPFGEYVVHQTRSQRKYSGISEDDIIETQVEHEKIKFLIEDALECANEMDSQHVSDAARHSKDCPEAEDDYADFSPSSPACPSSSLPAVVPLSSACPSSPLCSLLLKTPSALSTSSMPTSADPSLPTKSDYKYLREHQHFKAKGKGKLKRERELQEETADDSSTCPSEVESVKSHHRSNARAHARKRQKTNNPETGNASPSTIMPSTITPSTSSSGLSELKRKKQRNSQSKRNKKKEMRQSSGYAATTHARQCVSAKVEKIEAKINVETDVTTLKGGYRVKAEKLSEKMAAWTQWLCEAKEKKVDPCELIKELENDPEEPYRYIKWDGITPKVIVDSEDTVIGALAGHPDNNTYIERCNLLYAKMAEQTKTARFTKKNLFHQHGPYPSSDMGITFGPGDKKIHHLKLQKEEACLNEELRQLGLTEHIRKFVESEFH